MNITNKLWRILPLILFGGWYGCMLFKSFEADLRFGSYTFLLIGAIAFSSFAWIIHVDFDEFKSTRNWISFIPTATGTLLIVLLTAIYHDHYSRMNAPSLIRAFYEGEYTGFFVDLKENGHYVMSNQNGTRQSYFYGRYTLRDSTINLDRPNVGKIISGNTLVIRKVSDITPHHQQADTELQEYVFEVDSTGVKPDKAKYFLVIEDNRDR